MRHDTPHVCRRFFFKNQNRMIQTIIVFQNLSVLGIGRDFTLVTCFGFPPKWYPTTFFIIPFIRS
jgi:hypothetical protein